jgi:hypothetical protein
VNSECNQRTVKANSKSEQQKRTAWQRNSNLTLLSISDTRSIFYASGWLTDSRKYRTIMTMIPNKNFAQVVPYFSKIRLKYDGEQLGWHSVANAEWLEESRFRISTLDNESMKCPNKYGLFDKTLIDDCILNAPNISLVNCDHLFPDFPVNP